MTSRDAAISRGMAIRGKLLPEELGWLYDLARMAPDGPAVEVGAYCGRSVAAWSAARVGRGVGAWAAARASRGAIIASDIVCRPELPIALDGLGYPVELVIAPSWDAAALVPDDLAFVFIDADHGVDGIPKDILVWPQKVKRGGIIIFHDYDVWKERVHRPDNPDVVVKAEVDKWQVVAKWEDLGAVRSAKAYRRPE